MSSTEQNNDKIITKSIVYLYFTEMKNWSEFKKTHMFCSVYLM